MIRYASIDDLEIINQYDKHISKTELEKSVKDYRVIVYFKDDYFVGWLRYNLFWDNTPFMNLLFVLSEYRNQGFGKQLVRFWEEEMKKQGYLLVLTSTVSTESAQYFYRKLGYTDCGSFVLPQEPEELILLKSLN